MKQLVRNHGLLSRLGLLCGLLALLWLVTGCSDNGAPAAEATVVDDVAIVLEPTAVIATATSEVTPEPEPTVMIAELAPDTCTDCHTDKDMLIDTADPVEEVISENEGEG